MRKTIATAATLAMLFSQSAVFAADNVTNVLNSGNRLNVNTQVVENTTVNVTNTNNAMVIQTSNQTNNTGGNVANGNIDVGCGGVCGMGTTIHTGDAASTSSQSVTGNTNSTAIEVPAGNASNTTEVINTAGNANVTTVAVSNTTADVRNTNNAFVVQSSNQANNTGMNTANRNIGGAGIVTGNAYAESGQSVDVNHNTTVVKASDTPHGVGMGGFDICGFEDCLSNCEGAEGNCTAVMNTGRNLNVNTTSVSTTNVLVRNTNNMMAVQGVRQANNSGFNTANGNIGGGHIMTGTAGSVSGASVTGNSNATGVQVGMPLGANMFDIINSGANANTTATAVVTNNATTNNTNTMLGFQMTSSANSSGFNISNRNIGTHTTVSGHTGAGASTALGGNANTTVIGGNSLSLLTMLLML